jgi:hypothetical protein
MTKMKALSAIAVLCAAFATPVFAQDAGVFGPTYHGRTYDQQNFGEAYNQSNGPYTVPLTNKERNNIEDFGFSGRDPSMVGGEDPYLHPGG